MKKKVFAVLCIFLVISILFSVGFTLFSMQTFAGEDLSTTDREIIKDMKARVDFLRDDIMNFWLEHGLDPQYGGMYGTLDVEGTPIERLALGSINGYPVTSTDKGIIQQARHLWAYCTYYQMLKQNDQELPSSLIQSIESIRKFMMEHMKDPSNDRFYFMVSRDGQKVVHPGKNFYGNLYAMYALSKYAEVFGHKESKEQAIATFLSYDNSLHDAVFGGYDETGLIPVKDNSTLATGRLSKTLDTLLHAIECLTQLYKVVDDEKTSKLVADRLLELLNIAVAKSANKDGIYLYENFETDWKNSGSGILVYGHQFEFMWLAIDTLDVMFKKGTINQAQYDSMKNTFIKIGEFLTPQSFDNDKGGVYLAGNANKPPQRKDKHLWVQAESMNAFWYLYQYTGQNDYLHKLEKTILWVENTQRDPINGEWFAFISPEGKVTDKFNGFGLTFPGTAKGSATKASYHNGRSMMFLSQWLGSGMK